MRGTIMVLYKYYVTNLKVMMILNYIKILVMVEIIELVQYRKELDDDY